MRYDMLRLEQEAGAAAKGDAQALAALALRRDRVDARLVALAQPEHSDWIGRLHTDSDASKPVLQAAQRWSERRQHVERLLLSRDALHSLAAESREVAFAAWTIASNLDELGRSLVEANGDVRSLAQVARLELLLPILRDWPHTLLDVETPRIDGGFWNCGRDAWTLERVLAGLRHGDAESRIEAVRIDAAIDSLDAALKASSTLKASVDRICALEDDLDPAIEALAALRFREADWSVVESVP